MMFNLQTAGFGYGPGLSDMLFSTMMQGGPNVLPNMKHAIDLNGAFLSGQFGGAQGIFPQAQTLPMTQAAPVIAIDPAIEAKKAKEAKEAEEKLRKEKIADVHKEIQAILAQDMKGVEGGEQVKISKIREALAKLSDANDRQELITLLGENGLTQIFTTIKGVDPLGKNNKDIIKYLTTQDFKNYKENAEMITKVAKDMKINLSTHEFESAPVDKDGNVVLKDLSIEEALANKGVQERIISEMEASLKGVEINFEQAQKGNGFIGKAWDGVKELFGDENSSSNTQKKVDALKDKIEEAKKDPSKIAAVYQELTGKELDKASIEKFLTTDKKKKQDILAGTEGASFVKEYAEGQKMAQNITTDVAAGVVAVGAVALAVPTGGASIVAAAGIGAAAGGLTKAGLKAADKMSNDLTGDMSFAETGKDLLSGAVTGGLTVGTAGLGAVTKGAAVAAETTVAKEGILGGAKAMLESAAASKPAQIAAAGLKTSQQGAVIGAGTNATDHVLYSEEPVTIGNTLVAAGKGATTGAIGGFVLGAAAKGLGKGFSTNPKATAPKSEPLTLIDEQAHAATTSTQKSYKQHARNNTPLAAEQRKTMNSLACDLAEAEVKIPAMNKRIAELETKMARSINEEAELTTLRAEYKVLTEKYPNVQAENYHEGVAKMTDRNIENLEARRRK